jgi:hypothetical protein
VFPGSIFRIFASLRTKGRNRFWIAPKKICAAVMPLLLKHAEYYCGAQGELHERGAIPPGIRDSRAYRVRGANTVVPDTIHWVKGVEKEVTA